MRLKQIYDRSPSLYHLLYRIGKFVRRLRETSLQQSQRERKNADYVLISATNCGRTWLRVAIGRALQLHYQISAPDLNLHYLYSFSELNPNIPRIKASHERYEQFGSYKNYKIIFLVRDPRDAIVSRYMQKHHDKSNSKWSDISEFVRQSGELERGYLQLYNAWAKGKESCQDFLCVRYEDLKTDTAKELKRVFDFLNLPISDRAIAEAVEYGSFKNMRKLEVEGSTEVRAKVLNAAGKDQPETLKVRKGQVGGYRNYFSPDEAIELDRKIESELDPIYGYGSNPVSNSEIIQ